jgi:hypothetical protein
MDYSNGNIKIGRDTIIVNMTSATDCPSAKLGLCKVVANGKMWNCYAYRPEKFRPDCLDFRRRQTTQWDIETVEAIAKQFNAIIHSLRRKTQIKWLRFSEAGDFRSQDDIDKMSKLADLLDVPVYGYTARDDLDYSQVSHNMTVNGSGFMVHNEFKAVPKVTSKIHCQGDCRHCHICKLRRGVNIEVGIH